MVKHRFGGAHTEIKLAAIEAYSKFYTSVLKGWADTWYVDAFAGTGHRTQDMATGGLFEGEAIGTQEQTFDGSVTKALAVEPRFSHLIWIEQRAAHFKALEVVRSQHQDRDITLHRGDANTHIQSIFSNGPWAKPVLGSNARALVFLDPYGMNVKWRTHEILAATQRADVWYLANLKAAVQQLAHDHSAIDEDKRRSVSEFFGTPEWEQKFYKFSEAKRDLFSIEPSKGTRSVDRRNVAEFLEERLNTLYNYVSPPMALTVGNQDDYFLLFCLSNSQSGPAIGMIKKGVEWVRKQFF